MGLSLETRFGFWYAVRVFGLYVRESIANAGMRNSFGSATSGKAEKRKYCKVSWKELEAWRWESVCFPFS